jgi:murein DD-endopeptidase MepM/ murein hydrolase activator NlpD
MASGTGTIVKAQWCGGGGNCIKIKHNSTYSTVYAHLSKFAAGIKSKTKVKARTNYWLMLDPQDYLRDLICTMKLL